MTSVSLRPHDVSDFAGGLLRGLPELRGQLIAATGAAARAVATSPTPAGGALRDSAAELQRVVDGLDTSLGRLAAGLRAAAADLTAQDASMWGRPSAAVNPLRLRSPVGGDGARSEVTNPPGDGP